MRRAPARLSWRRTPPVGLKVFLRLLTEGGAGGLVSIVGARAADRPIAALYRIAAFPGDPPAPVTRGRPEGRRP